MSEQPAVLPPIALTDLRWQGFGALEGYRPCLGFRLWVPGGWLVDVTPEGNGEGVFVSDPDHTWDAQYAAWKEADRG